MDVIKTVFNRKKVNFSKLLAFGFIQSGDMCTYEKTLSGSGFSLIVRIGIEGDVCTEIRDLAFDEIYTLHLNEGAEGKFVGEVEKCYEETLREISEKCFDQDVFKSRQAAELIEYVRKKYSCEPEFLWNRFPDNAVWRREDSGKWFGVLLTVEKSKLGFELKDVAEIIDLHALPETVEKLVDNKRFLPGWHMNKKTWYTVILDGSVSTADICRRIDDSYALAKKQTAKT